MSRARFACNLGLIVAAAIVSVPLLWMIMSSIKPFSDIFAWPPKLFPSSVTLDHYVRVLEGTNFPRYFLNSTIVAVLVVVSNLLIALPCGYAFARLPIPGKDLAFLVVLGTMMIPSHVTTIPLFILARNFPLVGGNDVMGAGGTGLLNTYLGIALPHLVLTFTIFLARQFFLDLPAEIRDSGRIDGASEVRVFASLYLPISLPIVATIAIFSFVTAWDDFFWPLVVTTTDRMRTAQIGLSVFRSQFSSEWGALFAASVLIVLPVVIVFLFNQRLFIRGLATGATK